MKGIEIYQVKYGNNKGRQVPIHKRVLHSTMYNEQLAEATCRHLNIERLRGLDLSYYYKYNLSEILNDSSDALYFSNKIISMQRDLGVRIAVATIPKEAKHEDLVELLDMLSITFYVIGKEDENIPVQVLSISDIVHLRIDISVSNEKLNALLKEEVSLRDSLKEVERKAAEQTRFILNNSMKCWREEYPNINAVRIDTKSGTCFVAFSSIHTINSQVEKVITALCTKLKYKNIKKAYNQRVITF